MKHHRKRPRLARVPDAFLPLALALHTALFPRGALALRLYAAQLAVACLSLFACRGARVAFARQPAMRPARGSVKAALLLTLAGTATLSAAALLLHKHAKAALPWIAAGCLLNIEHIFYVYLYAVGEGDSAARARELTALFVFAGLVLRGDGARALWLPGLAGLAALVAVVLALVLGDGAAGAINAEVVRAAPRAALQAALYPCAAGFLVRLPGGAAAFFLGLALYELCGTPFRRAPEESRGFNRALVAFAAVSAAVLAAGWALGGERLTRLRLAAAALLIASACAFALYGRVGDMGGSKRNAF